jgi:hypothetical protein
MESEVRAAESCPGLSDGYTYNWTKINGP